MISNVLENQDFTISPGEVKTFTTPATISCIGLGSCVGVFLQDRVRGIAGGAHISLVENNEREANGEYSNVKKAIDELLHQLKDKGSDLKSLRAKVTGGSSSLTSSIQGIRSIESVINFLIEEDIFLAAMDVGGTQNRIAKFDVASGMLLVRHTDSNYYKVF